MPALLCPNCRERLSSVEQGLGGIWSCLYCEGTWLNADQLQQFLAQGCSEAVVIGEAVDGAPGCAACIETPLAVLTCGELSGLKCRHCLGGFFGKGIVQARAPQLASQAEEAPVLGAMLAVLGSPVLLSDPVLLAGGLKGRS